MTRSPFAAYANSALKFPVFSGALITDPKTGNKRPGTIALDVTALLKMSNDGDGKKAGLGADFREAEGIDPSAIYLEGYVVEVRRGLTPIGFLLPPQIGLKSKAEIIWDGKKGKFTCGWVENSPYGVTAITGHRLRGYFELTDFVVETDAIPGGPDEPGEPTIPIDEIAYTLEFQQANLSILGRLPVIHNLGESISSVLVFDNRNEVIWPDAIEIVNDNSLSIALQSYTPIAGVWRVAIGI